MTSPFFADDFFRREREQAEQLRKLMEPIDSLLRARMDLFASAVPASVRSMLEMHERTTERYLASLPNVEQIERSIRDLGAMARQPYLDAITSSLAQAERNAEFVKDLIGPSVLREPFAYQALNERWAVDLDRLAFRDARMFQQQISDATRRLLDQLRFVVPSPVREAIDDLTATIATRPFLAAVSAAGTPTDAQIVAKVKEHVSELLANSEGFAGFLHRLAALLPQVSSTVAAVLLFILMRLLMRQSDPPRHEQRAVVRRTQRLLAEQLSSYERQRVRVAGRMLAVRQSPRVTNSPIVGRLESATPVVRLRRGRHWTLVEYAYGDGSARGWVHTRYLRKPQ